MSILLVCVCVCVCVFVTVCAVYMRHIIGPYKFESGWEVGVIKTSIGFCPGSSAVIALEVTYDCNCSRRRPDVLFCCFFEVTYDCSEVCSS
jgi:hypothetical protein